MPLSVDKIRADHFLADLVYDKLHFKRGPLNRGFGSIHQDYFIVHLRFKQCFTTGQTENPGLNQSILDPSNSLIRSIFTEQLSLIKKKQGKVF